MDNKDHQKEITIPEFDNDKKLNDYQVLILKLKKIKENINLLEQELFN